VSGVFLAGSLLVVGAARASDGGSSDAGIDSSPYPIYDGPPTGNSDDGVLPCGIDRSSPPSPFGLALMAVGIAAAARRRRR
jgi:MYXO-CTERM domain-containing protein